MLCASVVLQASARDAAGELPCEVLSDIECCVAAPAVREVWRTTAANAENDDDGFGHTLSWQELYSSAGGVHGAGRPRECLPFLHLYPTPRTNAMSEAARRMTRQVLMRVLRRRLRQLRQCEATWVQHITDRTTSAAGGEVTWTARLLCDVARSITATDASHGLCEGSEDEDEDNNNNNNAMYSLTVTDVPVSGTCLPLRQLLRSPNHTPPRTLSLRLRVTALAVCTQSRHDAYTAGEVLRCLYRDYLVPAERHRSDGNEALQSCAGNDEASLAAERYEEAVAEYDASAARAQDGVLWLYEHCPTQDIYGAPITLEEQRRAEGEEAAGIAAAQRSCRAVHATLRALRGESSAVHDKVLAPAKVVAAEYVNEVLLCVRLDEARDAHLRRLHREVWEEAAALRPARAALAWRAPHAHAPQDAAAPFGSACVAPVTALQAVLYALQRGLVSAIANVSHVVLLQHRATQRTKEAGRQGMSLSALATRATSCEAAAAATLRLLRWHSPTAHRSGRDEERYEELRWCYTMYCKLLLRSARLWEAAGDAERRRDAVHTLQDALRRWRHRRAHTASVAPSSKHHCEEEEEGSRPGEANAETLVGRLSNEHWAQLERDVASGLRQ